MGKKLIPFDEIAAEWSKDPEYQAAREAELENYELARAIVAARVEAKLSQAEVARRMGTTQSTVSRLESGTGNATVESLRRYAKAIGKPVRISFGAGSRSRRQPRRYRAAR